MGHGHANDHAHDHADGGCEGLRRELARLEADAGADGTECAELRAKIAACCPSCADTVAADELFKRMLTRSCGERAPEHLRSKVGRWIQETCYSSSTAVSEDGTQLVHEQSVRVTRYSEG
ncbi:hypothetical protein [Dietzia sp.]|uniref:hypothetical protein n=1 Tax=Dietzia sp. TaxID=1871616 RepID=UPI002FDA6149